MKPEQLTVFTDTITKRKVYALDGHLGRYMPLDLNPEDEDALSAPGYGTPELIPEEELESILPSNARLPVSAQRRSCFHTVRP